MSEIVHIKAAEGISYLGFSDPTPGREASVEYFSVTFKAENLESAVRVWAYTDAKWLVTIFQDMEHNWRGKEGVKTWKAIKRSLV